MDRAPGLFFAFCLPKEQRGTARSGAKKGGPSRQIPLSETIDFPGSRTEPEPSPTDGRKRRPLGAGIHAAELG